MFGCAFIWSLCTTLAGLSTTLGELVFWRACVGIGTGAFNVIAPVMIADYFPIVERNYAYGILALAIPVGAAFGFGAGAVIGSAYNWRISFYALGIPSIALSFAVYLLNDPARGVNDATINFDVDTTAPQLAAVPDSDERDDDKPVTKSSEPVVEPNSLMAEWHSVKEIMTCPPFIVAVMGLTGSNFALSALADWLPTFLVRYCDANLDSAGIIVGMALVVGGISGNILGAQSTAYFEPRVKSASFLVPAVYCVPAAFLFLLVNNETSNLNAVYFYIFLSMIFCWTFVAPLAAVTVNVIRPSLRSLAGGLAHLVVSILGNIISPPIVGAVSDDTGSLRTAMQSVWITTLVAGAFWLGGYYFLPPLGDMSGSGDNPGGALSFSDFLWNGGIAAPGRNQGEEVFQDVVTNPMGSAADGDDEPDVENHKGKTHEETVDNSKYMTSATKMVHAAKRASYATAEKNAESNMSPLHAAGYSAVHDTGELGSGSDSTPADYEKAMNKKQSDSYAALDSSTNIF